MEERREGRSELEQDGRWKGKLEGIRGREETEKGWDRGKKERRIFF